MGAFRGCLEEFPIFQRYDRLGDMGTTDDTQFTLGAFYLSAHNR